MAENVYRGDLDTSYGIDDNGLWIEVSGPLVGVDDHWFDPVREELQASGFGRVDLDELQIPIVDGARVRVSVSNRRFEMRSASGLSLVTELSHLTCEDLEQVVQVGRIPVFVGEDFGLRAAQDLQQPLSLDRIREAALGNRLVVGDVIAT